VRLFKVWFRKPELSLSTVWPVNPVIVPRLEGVFGYNLFNVIKRDGDERGGGSYDPPSGACFG
jgi:hypothetical protein